LVSASLIVIWGVSTIAYSRRLIAKWKRWLDETGDRPLGNLPIFLYAAGNPLECKWEELDEYDFKLVLADYLLDASGTFQLVIGTFTATGLGISRYLA
jgi:hypothetical protein